VVVLSIIRLSSLADRPHPNPSPEGEGLSGSSTVSIVVEPVGGVEHAHGELGIFLRQKHRHLDLAGRDREDVDAPGRRAPWNICAAMPALERMPTPTALTLTTSVSVSTSSKPIAPRALLKRLDAVASEAVGTVKVRLLFSPNEGRSAR
jgi:hypothetical protein